MKHLTVRDFFLVILVVAGIYIYTNLSFATNGNRLKIARGGDIYGIYCGVFGKKFGKIAAVFFDYFSAFFCYMSFVVMCGGANATCTQQWGLPSGIGAIVLTALVVGTVILGLEGIVNTLGKVGPIIIAMILIVSIYTAITGIPNYSSNVQAVDAGVLFVSYSAGRKWKSSIIWSFLWWICYFMVCSILGRNWVKK